MSRKARNEEEQHLQNAGKAMGTGAVSANDEVDMMDSEQPEEQKENAVPIGTTSHSTSTDSSGSHPFLGDGHRKQPAMATISSNIVTEGTAEQKQQDLPDPLAKRCKTAAECAVQFGGAPTSHEIPPGLGKMRPESKGRRLQQQRSAQSAATDDEQPKYKHLLKKKPEVGQERPESFIFMDACSFKDLFDNSTLLMDRSGFISTVLEYRRGRNLVFALPPGCGKTCLVTMLVDFVDQERDPKAEDNLFRTEFEGKRQFAIMDWSDHEAHFCAHPTVFINFSKIRAKNAAELEEQINCILKNIFKAKRSLIRLWLINEERMADVEEFDKYSSVGFSRNFWHLALSFLCKQLNNYSKSKLGSKAQKTIVVVDGYDAPIMNYDFGIYDQQALRGIVKLVQKFMGDLFDIGDEAEKILVTGNYTFGLGNQSPLTICMERDLSKDNGPQIVQRISKFFGLGRSSKDDGANVCLQLSSFFGFGQEEVEELRLAYEVDSTTGSSMREYFNGITICSLPLYSTCSVLSMLRAFKDLGRKSLHVQFEPLPFFSHFEPLFAMPESVAVLQKLLSVGNHALGSHEKRFTDTDLYNLLSFTKAGISPTTFTDTDSFIRFLHMSGYLVRIDRSLRIPNEQMRKLIAEMITRKYYKREYQFEFSHLTAITDAIEEIVFDLEPTEGREMAHEQQLVKRIENFMSKNARVGRNECLLQTTVGMATLLLRHCTKSNLDKMMGESAGPNWRNRPDLVAFLGSSSTKGFALCIELKCKKDSLEKAMQQIVKNAYLTGSDVLCEEKVQTAIAMAIRMKDTPDGVPDEVEVKIERMQRRQTDTNVCAFLVRFQTYLHDQYSPQT